MGRIHSTVFSAAGEAGDAAAVLQNITSPDVGESRPASPWRRPGPLSPLAAGLGVLPGSTE